MTDLGLNRHEGVVVLHRADAARRESIGTTLGRLAVRAVDMLLTWQERTAARRHLSGLDDRLLADMGLSRADASRETDKPFWRA
jgi:uncharacterized protein YjiS (DUF1127 family)